MNSRHAFLQENPAEDTTFGLSAIVAGLRTSREVTHKIRHRGNLRELPSRDALQHILDGLCAALFPTHYGRTDLNDETIDYFVGGRLSTTLTLLREQVRRALLFTDAHHANDELPQLTESITRDFAHQLPAIRDILVTDIQAAFNSDPAATSVAETLLCYPGTIATIYHRIAHALYTLGTPLLARLIADIAHSATGIDIHPAARIGSHFFIDHGTGVVIGETAIIGQHVRLYQSVTLGAKRFPTDEHGVLIKGNARHPIIEDGVVIYAGATILGRITIGANSTIGGSVWLTRSVPPDSNITQAKMQSA